MSDLTDLVARLRGVPRALMLRPDADVCRPIHEAADCIERLSGKAEPECECDLRTKLVGDGCEVCNPELAKELAAPAPDDARDAARYRWLRERYQAMTFMQTAQSLGLDLRKRFVDSPEKLDQVIDAAMKDQP